MGNRKSSVVTPDPDTDTNVETDFVYIASDQERKFEEHNLRILQEREAELASVNRMSVSRAYAVRHIRKKNTPHTDCGPLGMSLCTGILRYIITTNYNNITRYIRVSYYLDNDIDFNTFLVLYGKNVKSDELLPGKTIQDMMLSCAERAVASACNIGLTLSVTAEVVWMIFTCLHNALPRQPGKKLFRFIASIMYPCIITEWGMTVKKTINVTLGRLPQSFSAAEAVRAAQLKAIKDSNAIDAKFGEPIMMPLSISGPPDTFAHRQRILEEKLHKKPTAIKVVPPPGSREAFNRNRLRLERVVSAIMIRPSYNT